MNILMPMVLNNTSTIDGGLYIKALYEIDRKTILEYIIERILTIANAKYNFVIHRQDIKTFHIDNILKLLIPDAHITIAQGNTMGSACSCLLAVDDIDNDEPLLIIGSDQIINSDLNNIIEFFLESDYDGGAVIFEDIHPRWSYVKLNEQDQVIEAAEKRPISKNACAGYYYFKSGKIFLEAAEQMVKKREMINGQYYICPVFNEMIIAGQTIGVYRIDKSDYFSLTSESGINAFELYVKTVKH